MQIQKVGRHVADVPGEAQRPCSAHGTSGLQLDSAILVYAQVNLAAVSAQMNAQVARVGRVRALTDASSA
jgi:hypothetical protein